MAESKKIATRESFGMALCELAKTNKDIVVFDADLAAATKALAGSLSMITQSILPCVRAVSYTHLDVYKRQELPRNAPHRNEDPSYSPHELHRHQPLPF